MIRDFVKDFSKYLPAHVIPGVITFVSIPILTRLFPPADYGNYSLAFATINVLIVLTGWLTMSTIRFYPSYEHDGRLAEFNNTVYKTAFFLILFLAIFFLVFIHLLKSRMSPNLYNLMLISVGVFTTTAFFSIIQGILRAKRLVNIYGFSQVWKSVTTIVIGLILVLIFGFGVEGLLLGSMISLTLAIPFLLRKTIKRVTSKSFFSKSLTIDMLKYGFPLVLGNLAAWILSLSDRYILEIFRGSHEVGIYAAPYNISENSIILLASLFMLASDPILIQIWEKEGEEKSKIFLSNLTRYYLIACIPVVVGLSILSKPIMSIMASQQYLEGYKIIPFVALGALFLGLQQRFHYGFLFHKKTVYIALFLLLASLLNLVLNVLFVPKYGYMAAAASTLISYAVLLLLAIVFTRKIFVWKFPYQTLIKSLIASIVMGLTIIYIVYYLQFFNASIRLLLSILFGIFVYFISIITLKELNSDETKALNEIWNKIKKPINI